MDDSYAAEKAYTLPSKCHNRRVFGMVGRLNHTQDSKQDIKPTLSWGKRGKEVLAMCTYFTSNQ